MLSSLFLLWGLRTSETENSSVALSGSVLSVGCLPGARAEPGDKPILWVTEPTRPRGTGNHFNRLPKGQPAGKTQVFCFSAPRIWSSTLSLEFIQEEKWREKQVAWWLARRVPWSCCSSSPSAKRRGYWSRPGLLALRELSHPWDRRAVAINYLVFKDGFLKAWLWAWSLYLYLSQEYFSNS